MINIVKSKFLDVLPWDIPYKIEPEIQTWTVDNGTLRLLISVNSDEPRTTQLLLHSTLSNLQRIAKLAERDLQNLFHCEVFVLISVNVTHDQKPARFKPLQSVKHFTPGIDRYLN